MKIAYTRAMVRAALGGGFSGIGVAKHPQFGLLMPESCPNVPSEVLNPRNTWRDKKAYDLTARDLTQRFEANFKQYETYVDDGVVADGIRAAACSDDRASGAAARRRGGQHRVHQRYSRDWQRKGSNTTH